MAPIDDLVRFRTSKVNVTPGRRDGEGIHVDAGRVDGRREAWAADPAQRASTVTSC